MVVLVAAEWTAADVAVAVFSKVDTNPGEVILERIAGDNLVAIHYIPKGAAPLYPERCWP
jgi:hypothetical protein